MILLMGGTSEARPIASRLAKAGFQVLVSTATRISLDIGRHPGIRRRSGRLDEKSLRRLIVRRHVRLVIDVTHPFALLAHDAIRAAALQAGIPCIRYNRPASALDGNMRRIIVTAKNHSEAAKKAFSSGLPVLLTTGSTHLEPYVQMAEKKGVPLTVRVLNRKASITACLSAGIPRKNIVTGRGPFSCLETRKHIRSSKAGILVTKDSGSEGGLQEKIKAAASEKCRVVLITRPPSKTGLVYQNIKKIVDEVVRILQ